MLNFVSAIFVIISLSKYSFFLKKNVKLSGVYDLGHKFGGSRQKDLVNSICHHFNIKKYISF
jgi:hypothetical protein